MGLSNRCGVGKITDPQAKYSISEDRELRPIDTCIN